MLILMFSRVKVITSEPRVSSTPERESIPGTGREDR